MSAEAIKVMVVDDSATARGMIGRIIDGEPDMRVVASAWNGRVAVDMLERQAVDVVLLDVDMPELDGLEALPRILARRPEVRVVMVSALTGAGAETTMRALALGASDYVPKPSAREGLGLADVASELTRKIRALSGGRPQARPRPENGPAASPGEGPAEATSVRPLPGRRKSGTPRVVAVVASTGGPHAIAKFLGDLSPELTTPILIVQHMPPLFTGMLAARITRVTGRPCTEATDGEAVIDGRIYVAPGNVHLTVERTPGGVVTRLDDSPAENFCKPSADRLLRSLPAVYGDAVLVVVLTGMGHDGTEGSRVVRHAGGRIVVQDEATSVVWGMPGSVAEAGLAEAVLPLDQIAAFVGGRLGGSR